MSDIAVGVLADLALAMKNLDDWECGPMPIDICASLSDAMPKSINFTETIGHRANVPRSRKRDDFNCRGCQCHTWVQISTQSNGYQISTINHNLLNLEILKIIKKWEDLRSQSRVWGTECESLDAILWNSSRLYQILEIKWFIFGWIYRVKYHLVMIFLKKNIKIIKLGAQWSYFCVFIALY